MNTLARTNRGFTLSLLAAALGVACAGGTPEPPSTYVLGATSAPLRYTMMAENNTVIEIPGGGEQKVETSSTAVFTVEYGEPSAAGLPFTVMYEAFEVTGAGTVDVAELLNLPIRGVVDSLGSVEVTDAPEVESTVPGLTGEALGQAIGPLAAIPLPSGGQPTDEPWSLQRSTSVGGGLVGETTYEGSVRFSPALEWEGTPARILVSEGTVVQRASGTPAGAPGEVEIQSDGTMRTTYAWDPARGLVLHVAQEMTTDGSVTVVAQGMVLPVTSSSTTTYALTEPVTDR